MTSVVLTLWCVAVIVIAVMQSIRAFVSNSLPLDRLLFGNAPLQISLDPAALKLGQPLPDSVELTTVTGVLHVHGDVIDRVLSLAALLPFTVIMFLALVILRRIVIDGRSSDPFTPTTTQRLSKLTVVLIGGGLLAIAINVVVMLLLLHRSGMDEIVTISFDPTMLTWTIFMGTATAGLATLFREGTRMRADVEGLV